MSTFAELNRLVQSTFAREMEKAAIVLKSTSRPTTSFYHGKSIHELTEEECRPYEHNGTFNHTSTTAAAAVSRSQSPEQEQQEQAFRTRMRILEGWKQLMDIMMEKQVFLDQIKTLKQGFVMSNSLSLKNVEHHNHFYDDNENENAISSTLRHMETLIRLLVQTAQHVERDGSTECRFATLLEILLSYADDVGGEDDPQQPPQPKWEPSEEVSRLWIRLMQRIPYQCAPTNFRRKAYRVLVSLSWVPSSKGLLAACSIPERSLRMTPLPKASQTYRSSAAASVSANHHHLSNKDNPPPDAPVIIPRHDSVNQLLDRLKDETDVCVAITSTQPGIGKSTLASLVVSHPSIQKSFYVVWLRLSGNNYENDPSNNPNGNSKKSSSHHNMSFEAYRDYMIQIRDQIREQQQSAAAGGEGEEEITFTFPTCEERFEEPAVRRLREEQAMQQTKERVAKELKALRNPNLLLVLENVTTDAQIPLFRFHEKQSTIVTTNRSTCDSSSSSSTSPLQSIDWQVGLDPLSCDEAVDLFLGHAGLPLSHPLGQTPELQAMLEKACQFLPLTIRTVARWCRLKSVAAGPIRACQEVIQEIDELLMDDEDYEDEHNNKNNNHNNDPAAPSQSSSQQHRSSLTSLGSGAGGNNNDDGGSGTGGATATANRIPKKPQDAKAKQFLFDVLSLMIGPSQKKGSNNGGATSAVFVVCLAAMAVVFPSGQRVPLDVVLLLWEQILIVEPVVANEVSTLIDLRNAKNSNNKNNHKNGKHNKNNNKESRKERRQFVGMIAQGLLHMGIVEIYEVDNNTWIEIHHNMYEQFAWTMANGLDLGESSFDHTVQKWHKAFVTSYFEQRIQKNIAIEAVGGRNSLDYAVRFLPTHIFQACMMKMAETMLVDTRFFETRVNALGWDRAVALHIQDCLQLQSGFLDYHAHQNSKSTLSSNTSTLTSSSSSSSTGGPNNMLDLLMVSPVFAKSSAMISSFDTTRMNDDDDDSNEENYYNSSNEYNSDHEDSEGRRKVTSADVSRALYRMAFALAGHGYFEEALAQFSAAQKIVPDSVNLQASIMYGIAWVLLVSGDSKRALRKISSALKLMKDFDPPHPQQRQHLLYKEARQLHIDTLYERCDYKKALNFLGEIESELLQNRDQNMIELGAVLRKRGCLLQVMGKTKEAADALIKAIEWKEKAQECSYGLASCYSQLGDVNMELHALSGTRDYFERAVSTLIDARCDQEHISYLVATGKLYFTKNDFTRCFEALESARNAIRVAPLYLMDQSAYDLRCIARAYRARRNMKMAIEVFRESLTLTAHRPNSLERACCLRELAKCLLEGRKNDDEGLGCLQEALSIIMIDLGHCIQVFDLMNTIALVHKMRGEYAESLKVYGKAANILETVAPDDTEKEANVYFSVGEVEEARDNLDGALGAYKQAAAILQQTHASDDPNFAKANQFMARVLLASHRLDEARQKLEEAVRIRSHHFDERALAEAKFALGVVLRKLGASDDAEQYLRASLAVRERYNEGSHEHMETMFELGNLYLLSKPADALVYYENCIDKLDNNDALRGDVYQAMGHVKFFEMKEDEALLFYRRARDIRQTHHGRDHRKTANSVRGIGLTQLFFRHKEEAERTLELLCDICEGLARQAASTTYGAAKRITATRDYVLATIFLGDAYFANKRKHDAALLWNKAQSIYEQAQVDSVELPAEIRDIYEHRLVAITQGRNSVASEHKEAQALASMIYADD
ncbi:hypothetical protein ACA910_017030 [Epithemia clementina (nom. ined.)]